MINKISSNNFKKTFYYYLFLQKNLNNLRKISGIALVIWEMECIE